MMTLKDVINFYFAKYETIHLKIQMVDGIKGKYLTVTKDDLAYVLEDWGDSEVVDFGWQSYYTSLTHIVEKMNIPTAWIMIK